MKALRIAPLALVAAVAGGCTTQWYPGFEHADVARTDVVIRTEPPGATVLFNGVKQQEVSPIRIPVDYEHTETMYERQSNYGRTMRDDMSPVVTVLTFPVWAVASLFHYRETLRRHEYGGNVHDVTAFADGYEEAEETVTLEGQAEVEVRLKLIRAR